MGQSLAASSSPSNPCAKLAGNAAAVTDLRTAIGIVASLVDFTKDIARGLRPPILDDLGLAASLRWYVGQLPRPSRPSCGSSKPLAAGAFAPTGNGRLSHGPGSGVNALRHARRGRRRRPVGRDGALRVTVQDDGVGFDLAEAEERSRRLRSLGLLGMRNVPPQRVGIAGGKRARGWQHVVSLRFALQEGSGWRSNDPLTGRCNREGERSQAVPFAIKRRAEALPPTDQQWRRENPGRPSLQIVRSWGGR